MKSRWGKRLTEAGILIVVFIVAVFAFSYLTNDGNEEEMADMAGATLPQVSFSCYGYDINTLNGHVRKMDVTTMRDTVTPVLKSQLELQLEDYGESVDSLKYQLCTLDGKKVLQEDTIKTPEKKVTLKLDKSKLGEERVLILTLTKGEQKIYYYTRVVNGSGFDLKDSLDYVKKFHKSTLNKTENSIVNTAIEPSPEEDNSSFSHVTIHSDYAHVTWGNLAPEIVGEEKWEIIESNEVYTSLLLEYRVKCTNKDKSADTYVVKEYFKVRKAFENMYLLDYDRTMEQVFSSGPKALSEKGVILGIRPADVDYKVNSDGTIVSFVQANELWNYNKKTDSLSMVFSFMSPESSDVRNAISDHTIKILSVEENGNTAFAVYGYMNRGMHEGNVGVSIFNYDIEKNSVEEVAFLPSTASAEITEREIGKLIYYSRERHTLCILMGGALHEISMEDGSDEIKGKDFKDGQYAVSPGRNLVAYQCGGNLYEANEIKIRNLETGKDYKSIQAEEGESIRPLGFVKNDLVYGVARKSDKGVTISGEKILPMHQLKIKNPAGDVLKEWQRKDQYIQDASIDGGMITIDLLTKEEDVYTSIDPAYITNNEQKGKSNISEESIVTEERGTLVMLQFADGLPDQKAKLLRPRQAMNEEVHELEAYERSDKERRYYVYAYGILQGIYDKAGAAVVKADELKGVAITQNQEYLWERGNKPEAEDISESSKVNKILKKAEKGTSFMDILSEISDGKETDFTGCTTEEMTYLVGKEIPVIGMIDSEQAVILTGYRGENVVYIDVETGESHSASCEEMDELLAGTGRTFLSYIK